MTAIGLGWRIHHSSAVVVAVSGPAASPTVIHRDEVTLVGDESRREPYHAAVALPLDDVPAFIESVAEAATAAAVSAMSGIVASLGAVAAVGVVGGSRKLPAELRQILAKHARLHEAERDLYEQAIIEAAARSGLPVTTIPATGRLLDEASQVLGVALAPSLSVLGKSLGQPWKKDHKEAAAAALVALAALR